MIFISILFGASVFLALLSLSKSLMSPDYSQRRATREPLAPQEEKERFFSHVNFVKQYTTFISLSVVFYSVACKYSRL